jgi:hypothetical protein
MSAAIAGGVFATADETMRDFLIRISALPVENDAFVARNFLLDEGVSVERFESYRLSGCVREYPIVADWTRAHDEYLLEKVFRTSDGDDPPRRVDPLDSNRCPETFRLFPTRAPVEADEGLHLVRVDTARSVARGAGLTIDALTSLAERTLTGDAGAATALDAGLRMWTSRIDRRPAFAAFWDDVSELFNATGDWPNLLRDRLGLAHLDPAERGDIRVLVFRYAISQVPRSARPDPVRLIVGPSVLDGTHWPQFCPSPKEESTGHTMDLSGNLDWPRREVVHANVRIGSANLFRVGTITRSIPSDRRTARGLHLLLIRERCSRDDYGRGTDADLA